MAGCRCNIDDLSLIHISEPTRLGMISYAVFCLKKKGFGVELKFQEIDKYKTRTNQWLRYMRVKKNNRLRSGYKCCCCCCCCCCCSAAARCVWSMLYGSHAKAVNRRHRRVMCSVCVRRAMRYASVAPKPKARQVFSLTGRASEKEQHTEHPRQHAAVVDKAHGGVIDVASVPCQPSAA